MKRLLAALLLIVIFPSFAESDGRIADMMRRWNDPAIQKIEEFQIFDNVYYVGIEWVAAYVIKTNDGLILIDSLYGPWVEHLVEGIVKLGMDPNDIRYVLVTHAHFDHHGGAAEIQAQYGAKIVMTENDWQLASDSVDAGVLSTPSPKKDVVAKDGEWIQVGGTRVKFIESPGHTTGVLSLEFTVRDGDYEYTAFTLGGAGLNFTGVLQSESYVGSMRRIQSFDHIEVSLPNHAAMGQVFERAGRLKKRTKKQLHPFVDPKGFYSWVTGLLAQGEEKLAAEHVGISTDPLQELSNLSERIASQGGTPPPVVSE